MTRSMTWFVLVAAGVMGLFGSLALWQSSLGAAACAANPDQLLISCLAPPDAWRFAITLGIAVIAAAAALRELAVDR